MGNYTRYTRIYTDYTIGGDLTVYDTMHYSVWRGINM